MRILTLQTSGMGDVVMLLPLLSEIQRLHPDVAVDLLVNSKAAAELVAAEGVIQHVYTRPCSVLSLGMLRLIARMILRYDAVIHAWTNAPASHKKGLLVKATGARLRAISSPGREARPGFTDILEYKHTIHVVEGNIRLGRLLFPDLEVVPPKITLSDAEQQFAEEFIKANEGKILGIHPGSGAIDTVKRWPTARFVEVAQAVLKDGACDSIWIFLGPDELELASFFQSLPQVQVISGHSIRETAALAFRTSVFLTSDSGLGHIASAVGVPVVTIMGPGYESRIRPYGPNNSVLTADVPCRPCNYTPLYWDCPYERRCLTEITPQTVLQALAKVLRCKG